MAQQSTETHPNSRFITIFRTKSYLEKAQRGPEVDNFMSMTKQPIGSYYESSDSAVTGTGLTPSEIELLLPRQLMMDPSDREFRPKVKEWYDKRSTDIPHKEGRRLEIGLEKDNNKPVSQDNLPIKLIDYLLYRHALGHPHVAPSQAAAYGNQMFKYYIFDKLAAERELAATDSAKDAALKVYFSMAEEPKKVDTMLTMLGIDPRDFTGPNAESLRKAALRKSADEKPAEFVKTSSLDSFDERYMIKTMINVNVLTQIGNSIVSASNAELVIGHNEDEAVMFFKDPKNSQTIALLKQSAQEGLKKPKAGAKK